MTLCPNILKMPCIFIGDINNIVFSYFCSRLSAEQLRPERYHHIPYHLPSGNSGFYGTTGSHPALLVALLLQVFGFQLSMLNRPNHISQNRLMSLFTWGGL